MSTVMEYEKRVMLTEEQYFALVSFYIRQNPHYPFINQVNYYYDTEDLFLKQNHMVLRMRDIPHKGSELTLKSKEENGDREDNMRLTLMQHSSLLKKGHFPKCRIIETVIRLGRPLHEYKLLTKLETRRLEIKENDYLVVIDKNEYNGIIDYNLEIEAKSRERAQEVILEFCDKFSLQYRGDYQSKSSRALKSIQK